MPFLEGLRANLNLGYDISKSNGDVIINDNSLMTYTWGRYKAGWEKTHGTTSTNATHCSISTSTLTEIWVLHTILTPWQVTLGNISILKPKMSTPIQRLCRKKLAKSFTQMAMTTRAKAMWFHFRTSELLTFRPLPPYGYCPQRRLFTIQPRQPVGSVSLCC